MDQLLAYFEKTVDGSKPMLACFVTGVVYWVFPENTFMIAAVAVLFAMGLDLLTKIVSLSYVAGSPVAAVRACTLRSEPLWKGTLTKIYAYTIVFVLIGLVYRVSPFNAIGEVFGSVVYTTILLREGFSILENLCDAGADLGWLKVWIKKKEGEVLDTQVEDVTPKGDEDESI
jgi:hypothetical protein